MKKEEKRAFDYIQECIDQSYQRLSYSMILNSKTLFLPISIYPLEILQDYFLALLLLIPKNRLRFYK